MGYCDSLSPKRYDFCSATPLKIFGPKAGDIDTPEEIGTLTKGVLGELASGLRIKPPISPTSDWKLYFDTTAIDDF
ncbi:MAG: hypothetical protein ACRC8S_12110 [Fimbriiglobus sp.]